MKYDTGDFYRGGWYDGLLNGKGEYVWADGTRCDGYFEDG